MTSQHTVEVLAPESHESVAESYYDVVKKSETHSPRKDAAEIKTGLVKIDPTDTCNARKKDKEKPGYCGQTAGWGTTHVGYGRCKLHGGASPYKHGLYSDVAKKRYTIKDFIEIAKNDPETFHISTQMSLQMGLLSERVEAIAKRQREGGDEDKALLRDEWEALLKISDKLTKTFERKARVEQSERKNIPIEVLDIVINGVIATIERFIPDEKLRAQISGALNSLPVPRGVVVDNTEQVNVEDAVVISESD